MEFEDLSEAQQQYATYLIMEASTTTEPCDMPEMEDSIILEVSKMTDKQCDEQLLGELYEEGIFNDTIS